MFRAINKETGKDIIILEEKWTSKVNEVRMLAHKNLIICPGCKQPVNIRAGIERVWHFAHKHLLNCQHGRESTILMQARVVLYKWLVSKFKENVAIEKSFNDDRIPRCADFWVKTDKCQIVYWIIESSMKPDKRNNLRMAFSQLKIQVVWVFIKDMLREDKGRPNCIHLTKTEREFSCQTQYDETITGSLIIKGKSLHYLDPEHETLTTYRLLQMVHAPQLYKGQKRENKLHAVLVSPKNGGFVHPGEHEKYVKIKNEKNKFDNRKGKKQKFIKRKYNNFHPIGAPPQKHVGEKNNQLPEMRQYLEKAKCILCGRITDKYWYLSGKTKMCKCNECYRQGKY